MKSEILNILSYIKHQQWQTWCFSKYLMTPCSAVQHSFAGLHLSNFYWGGVTMWCCETNKATNVNKSVSLDISGSYKKAFVYLCKLLFRESNHPQTPNKYIQPCSFGCCFMEHLGHIHLTRTYKAATNTKQQIQRIIKQRMKPNSTNHSQAGWTGGLRWRHEFSL